MVAVGAVVAGEAGGEVATAEEVLDVSDGLRAEGSHGGAVVGFVAREEVVPARAHQRTVAEGVERAPVLAACFRRWPVTRQRRRADGAVLSQEKVAPARPLSRANRRDEAERRLLLVARRLPRSRRTAIFTRLPQLRSRQDIDRVYVVDPKLLPTAQHGMVCGPRLKERSI